MSRPVAFGALAVVVLSCTPGDPGGPPPDGGQPDGGQVAPSSRWSWVPVEGSRCARGATAGIGVNPSDAGTELLLYLQGGGACWNTGTCVPSWIQFGPLCYYDTVCLVDAAGGTQPTSSYVGVEDPFPADGGGAFPGELATISSSALFDRADPRNPFRTATYVFVPYCTGDLHGGDATRSYSYKVGLFDPVQQRTIHFAGATNMDAYLAYLRAAYPDTERVWLTGSSAGGYGAALNWERVRAAFPAAEVHVLSDSAPLVPSAHWTEWRDTWNLQLPAGCGDCDGGFPQLFDHLAATNPDGRMALLAYDRDRVISWFFYASPGLEAFTNPPMDYYAAQLGQLEARFDAHANTRYFVLGGDQHVMLAGYGMKLADGGTTTPVPSPDGGSNLQLFIDAWATGDPSWASHR